jgi:hypothetical protein
MAFLELSMPFLLLQALPCCAALRALVTLVQVLDCPTLLRSCSRSVQLTHLSLPTLTTVETHTNPPQCLPLANLLLRVAPLLVHTALLLLRTALLLFCTALLLLRIALLLLRTALLSICMAPLLLLHAALLLVLLLLFLLLLAQGAIAPASPCSWPILCLSLTQLVQLEWTLRPSPDGPQNKVLA